LIFSFELKPKAPETEKETDFAIGAIFDGSASAPVQNAGRLQPK
jgi:hypothetical protein